MRASGRSTLFTTRITGSRASSALRSTKRVCGSGPSLASTSRSTPSTIVSPRSTSPPKSAWPGVSTMLIFVRAVADGRVLGEDRDALLALEVAGVEHALGHVLVRAEGAGLPEQRVDERRLAVVDVRDDGDVADIRADGHRLRVATGTRAPVGALVRPSLSVGCLARAVPGADATLVVVAERARPADRLRAHGSRRARRSACTCCRTPSPLRAPR